MIQRRHTHSSVFHRLLHDNVAIVAFCVIFAVVSFITMSAMANSNRNEIEKEMEEAIKEAQSNLRLTINRHQDEKGDNKDKSLEIKSREDSIQRLDISIIAIKEQIEKEDPLHKFHEHKPPKPHIHRSEEEENDHSHTKVAVLSYFYVARSNPFPTAAVRSFLDSLARQSHPKDQIVLTFVIYKEGSDIAPIALMKELWEFAKHYDEVHIFELTNENLLLASSSLTAPPSKSRSPILAHPSNYSWAPSPVSAQLNNYLISKTDLSEFDFALFCPPIVELPEDLISTLILKDKDVIFTNLDYNPKEKVKYEMPNEIEKLAFWQPLFLVRNSVLADGAFFPPHPYRRSWLPEKGYFTARELNYTLWEDPMVIVHFPHTLEDEK